MIGREQQHREACLCKGAGDMHKAGINRDNQIGDRTERGCIFNPGITIQRCLEMVDGSGKLHLRIGEIMMQAEPVELW